MDGIPDYDERLAAKVPPHLLTGLVEYATKRTRTGSFLAAVLANDLKETIARGDAESLAALKDVVAFVYYCLPGACHGSEEIVDSWLNYRRRAKAV